jgi:drug/metabolite transporter (DMT)-like permease
MAPFLLQKTRRWREKNLEWQLSLMRTSEKHRLSIIGLFIATVGWGASFFLVKKATSEVGMWPFLLWRFGLATTALAILMPRKLTGANRALITKASALGVLLFLAIWTQTQGLQFTTATRSGFLTALYVPMTPIIGWMLFRHSIVWRQLAVALVAVGGLYVLTSAGNLGESFLEWWRDVNPGDLWTVATAVVSALHIVLTEKFSREERDSIALALWQFIFCFALVAIVAGTLHNQAPLETGHWNVRDWSTFAWGSVIFNAAIATVFGFVMQIVGQKTVGALKAALIFALEAPFSSIFAFLFLSERLSLQEAAGALIVFLTSIIPEPWLKKRVEEN